MDHDWQADLARYGGRRAFFREQSLWAVWVYRWGRRLQTGASGPWGAVTRKLYWPVFRLVETMTGISLPPTARIGPGLRIWHFGGIFLHDKVQIGAGCTLRQGVTIGNRYADGPVPVIGDDVELGAYAQVLGGITVGNGARIGAMSVVLRDVPAGATAVGNPARIISGSAVS